MTHEMDAANPIPGGSGARPTSAAFRKAARWLKHRLQITEYWNSTFEHLETNERAGIGEDALRILRERYKVEDQ